MSSGLLALLDDVAAIAKMAAASLDDVAAGAMKASAKATGIVIDDTAVTPRYVTGFASERELPIIGKIAYGSIKNKLIYLLPAAVGLSYFAPWAITPLLMAGGTFLCCEGYEKLVELLSGNGHKDDVDMTGLSPEQARIIEDQRVSGAIRTDMILSAEIMALSLATVSDQPIMIQVLSLVAVAFIVTGLVYGLVALIVKADDIGVRLARRSSGFSQALGKLLVAGMPKMLKGLSVVGTLAMLWVGGGIILHGLAQYGLGWPEHALVDLGSAIGAVIPLIGGLVAWLVTAAGSGVVGAAIGWIAAKAVHAAGIELH